MKLVSTSVPDASESNRPRPIRRLARNRAILSAVLIGGALALAYLGWSVYQTQRPGARHYLAGIEYLAQKKPVQAETEWIQGAKEDPSYPANAEQLGDFYATVRRHEEAAVCYRRAVKLSPDDGTLYLRLSREQHLLLRDDLAYENAKKAAEMLPDNPDAQGHFGMLEADRNHYAAAIPLLERALKLRPDAADFTLALIRCKFMHNDYHGAEISTENWLKAHAGDPEAMLWRAKIANKKPRTASNVARAIQAAEEALAANPDNTEPYGILGQLYVDAGEVTNALKVFRQGYTVNPSSTLIMRGLVACYGQTGQTASQKRMSERLRKINDLYERIDHVNEQVHLTNGMDMNKNLELARLEMEAGNYQVAEKFYTQLSSLAPNDPRVNSAVLTFHRRMEQVKAEPAPSAP